MFYTHIVNPFKPGTPRRGGPICCASSFVLVIIRFRVLARLLLPIVSYFPLSMLFYGSKGEQFEPKYQRFWKEADLIASDFLFMRKYMPDDLAGKTIVTNTTTAENIELLRTRGVQTVITTTPRYEGRSFGTNLTEATLTAYAGKGINIARPYGHKRHLRGNCTFCGSNINRLTLCKGKAAG